MEPIFSGIATVYVSYVYKLYIKALNHIIAKKISRFLFPIK